MLRTVLIAALAISGTAFGQHRLQLPQDPRLWFNAKPLSLEAMKGKGVVLYFFEEG